MLATLFSSPLFFIVWAVGLVLAICVHEYSHAVAADRLGDPTPRAQGRLTLDPRAHLDPLGTLALLFLGFGWGKPVTFDPYNLRNPRRDGALIALAGPIANLIFASLLSLLLHFVPLLQMFSGVLSILILMNISLAIFNLVPIFPLDGEKILGGILPSDIYLKYAQVMRQYGTIILIAMLLPIVGGISPISALISPIISFVSHLLL